MLSSHAALGLALLHVTVNLVLRTEQVRPTGKTCGGGGGNRGWGGGVQRRGDEGVPETDVPSSRFFHEKVTRRSC